MQAVIYFSFTGCSIDYCNGYRLVGEETPKWIASSHVLRLETRSNSHNICAMEIKEQVVLFCGALLTLYILFEILFSLIKITSLPVGCIPSIHIGVVVPQWSGSTQDVAIAPYMPFVPNRYQLIPASYTNQFDNWLKRFLSSFDHIYSLYIVVMDC